MKKLTALPLAGEAYVLEAAGKTILVDGGLSSTKLVQALRTSLPDLKQIDVVVCTHADADHAGGLTDFLDKATVPVGEFWLPGSWSDALEDLLTAPGHFMEELREEILGEHGDRELLEALSSSEDQRVDRALSDDLLPSSRTSVKLAKSVNQENDGHEEEQVHRGADHRVHPPGRGRDAGEGAMPQRRL